MCFPGEAMFAFKDSVGAMIWESFGVSMIRVSHYNTGCKVFGFRG